MCLQQLWKGKHIWHNRLQWMCKCCWFVEMEDPDHSVSEEVAYNNWEIKKYYSAKCNCICEFIPNKSLRRYRVKILEGGSNFCLTCTEIEKQFKNRFVIWTSYIVEAQSQDSKNNMSRVLYGGQNHDVHVHKRLLLGKLRGKKTLKNQKWICNYILHRKST